MQRATVVTADRPGMARPEPGTPAVRLARFVLERFPPVSYGSLIAALVLCGAAGAALSRGAPLHVGWSQAMVAIAAWLGFLQLRVLDELRDEAADRIGRPDRPLPRGLVSRAELRCLAVGAGIIGVALAATLGPTVLVCFGLVLGQVWILDVLDGRRPTALRGMVATALIHSAIVPTMLLAAWAAAAPPAASAPLAATLLLAWGAGLSLEVGRKTLQGGEERPGIASYSAALGRSRALELLALLLTVTGVGATVLALAVGSSVPIGFLPLGSAAAASLVVIAMGDRVDTGALRAGVPLAVLAALLWPVLLAGGLR